MSVPRRITNHEPPFGEVGNDCANEVCNLSLLKRMKCINYFGGRVGDSQFLCLKLNFQIPLGQYWLFLGSG